MRMRMWMTVFVARNASESHGEMGRDKGQCRD